MDMTLEQAREALFSLEETNRRNEMRVRRLDALNAVLRRLLSTRGDRVMGEVFQASRCFLSFDEAAVMREEGGVLVHVTHPLPGAARSPVTKTAAKVLAGRPIAANLGRVLNCDDPAEAQRAALCAPLPLESARGFVLFVRNAGAAPFNREEIEHGQSLTLLVSEALALREREDARAESRAKTAFLATMSHELRTPLNGIIGMTALLAQEQMPVDRREKLGAIEACGQALLDLIDSVLDYARNENTNPDLAMEPVSPDALARSAAAIVAHSIEQRGVAFSIDIAPDAPASLTTDPRRMRQVLVNLLGNAQKFTASGSIRLTVSRAPAGGRSGVRFAVSDTGIGIPEEARPRLFRAFSQVDSSIARRFGGTGLGLAICRQIVEGLGGAIDFESRPGEGSTFFVDLPCAEAGSLASDSAPPPHASSQPQEAAPAQTPALRVLVAEDNKVNQTVARLMLEGLGHEVRIVENGQEALDALEEAATGQRAFDLVLMDMQMPVMDGISAAREIARRGGEIARAPVVALTANAFDVDREACLAASMKGFIAKPLTPVKLRAAIAQVFAAPPAAAA